MLDAQGQHIRLNHAREYLRQHFAIDAGLDNMDFRPLGSDPKQVDNETRAQCREQMSACRERAHETLSGLIGGAKISVWRETDEGGMGVAAPTWARAAFDGQDCQRADKLYFATSDWETLLPKLTSPESRRYFFEQRTNPPLPSRSTNGNAKQFAGATCFDLANQSNLDGLGEWCLCFQAVRRLHQRLKDDVGDSDPAPWIEMAEWPDNLETLKWNARTGLTFRRALLTGNLKAYYLEDDGEQLVPGWAWANEHAAGEAMHAISLPSDPFLSGFSPHDLRVYIRRTELEAWLQRSDVTSADDLPNLPMAYDAASKPEPITYSEPPQKPFVDLTEAITWTAFRVAMSRDVFMLGEHYRFGPFEADDYSAKLDLAVRDFAAKAGGGLIRVRGRNAPAFYDRQSEAAGTSDLTDNQLRDFARYDLTHGGLLFGTGWVRLGDPIDSRRDGWRDVEVSRADLIKAFPAQDQEARVFSTPIPASLPEIGTVMPLHEALSWLAHGKPSHDIEIWQNAAGGWIFRDPSGAVIKPHVDGSHPPIIETYRQASRTLHSALRDGSLLSYVAPASGTPLQVPRLYWNGVNPESLRYAYPGVTPDYHGAGCPVLLSRQSFDAWRAAISPIKAPEKTRLSHGYVVNWCKHWIESGNGNGMDKAWQDFQATPEHHGLSRDDVCRPAWREAKTR